ncbi:RNA exonuclease 1 homolog [Protopterus annectens]|uniref:RNA exonuclease 1 homolog n=1 Tax=Protopterus annectens TaxID=7888 RepID=UPI001CF995B8|nr:RNA exonuclease 1 homolog [Protopterus annectens]
MMLRSSGYFCRIDCPFDLRGLCQRPYCQYRHTRGTENGVFPRFAVEASSNSQSDILGGKIATFKWKSAENIISNSSKPLQSIMSNGGQQSQVDDPKRCGSPVMENSAQSICALSSVEFGPNIKELERITRAIEAVKTEVKQNQKKLSDYRILLQNNPSTAVITEKTEQVVSGQDTGFEENLPELSSDSNSMTRSSLSGAKYILEHSMPLTDLEYDPLLNYSAELLNAETQNETEKQVCKNTAECINENEHVSSCKTKMTGNSANEFHDSDEDVLVIDAPPLEDTRRKYRKRACDMYKKGASSEVPEKKALHETDAPDSCLKDTGEYKQLSAPYRSSPSKSPIIQDCSNASLKAELGAATDKSTGSSSLTVDISHDSLASLKVNSEECLRIPALQKQAQEAHISEGRVTSGLSREHCSQNNRVALHLKGFTEPSLIPVSYKSVKPEQVVVKEMKEIADKQYNATKKFSQTYTDTAASRKEAPNTKGSNLHQPKIERIQKIQPDLGKTAKDHSKKDHSDAGSKVTEIIVLDDSSESESSEEDAELSDSDPMEECLRIFNEFNRSNKQQQNKGTVQTFSDEQGEDDKLDPQGAQSLVPGQKKRIAHVAKFNQVQTSRQILVPARGRAPQLTCPNRMVQVQQQAAHLTAAVKSGQAFVATTGQKKVVAGLASPQIYTLGQQAVCFNIVEQPSLPAATSAISVILQGGTISFATRALTSPPAAPAPKRIPHTQSVKNIVRRRPLSADPGSKIPYDTRQRYVNFFAEEYLKISTVQEAFDKALNEEKAVYDRSSSKNMYLTIAVNTLKKLREQNGTLSVNGLQCGGRDQKKQDKNDFTGLALYRHLLEYILTEQQLQENGYPRPHPEKKGMAILYSGVSKDLVVDPLKRVCCRCGKIYTVTGKGRHVRKEECNYHWGRVVRHRVPGGLETRYSCCEGVVGSQGCQSAKAHVHDGRKENPSGFMKTFAKLPKGDGNPGVYAVDCEMCYTTHGLELARVTVVDSNLQVVYDTFVKPDNEIVDYNTRFSGVTEEDLKNTKTCIRDVQAVLLNLFNMDTILIGHSLESDLFALKLLHSKVVDTSLMFPHRLGLPYKRALKNLSAEYLMRIIQDNFGGHDSREDAAACMELVLWKVKEDSKGKK